MARDFDGVNDNIDFGGIDVIDDATTLTCSVWVINDALTADMNIVANTSITTDGFRLYFDDVGSVSGRTNVYNIYVAETVAAGSSNNRVESATNSALQDTWQHICFSAEVGSATGLELWIDGVEDANSPSSLSALGNLGSAATNEGTRLGETPGGGADRNGKLAEVAFWNRILTDAEKVILSKGFSPLFIPNGLIFYAPLIGRGSAEPDIKGGKSGTLAGTANFAHPRIIYPSAQEIRRFTTTPASTVEWNIALVKV